MDTKTQKSSETLGFDWHLVRIGLHGQVGRFWNSESLVFQRRNRVVCRTARGLEVGEIVNSTASGNVSPAEADGRLLRRMRPEDELLQGHLSSLSNEVHEECEQWLRSQNVDCVLLDVEPLLDGKTLYFHFLTPQSDRIVEQHLDYLTSCYEQRVAQSEFAKLLTEGCGPGCGTEEAVNGCGSKGGCQTCSLAKACNSKSK